jgi:hypothetical protein
MPVVYAHVLHLHWDDRDSATTEATLEVEHENGDRQLFVVPILRMSERIAKEEIDKPREL